LERRGKERGKVSYGKLPNTTPDAAINEDD
jgi:hypothetical protein